ncbi:MAG: CDP-alcohol phosphatidyltransferase family protein [Limnochordales bacterium]|nr:CDP-alcohol phosphatidyltransferase family protein [Limnochordales bacterium]
MDTRQQLGHDVINKQAKTGLRRDWTGREESFRDNLLGTLLDRLPAGLEPDHLTRARLGLVLIAAADYLLRRSFRDHLVLIGAALVTDLIDGPLARRRGKVHAEGARLDQRADTLLGAWLGLLTLWTAAAPLWLLALIAGSQLLVWTAELHRHRLLGAAAPALSGLAIGVAPPRPNLAGRLQFTFVVAGFLSLLADAHLGWPLRTVGIRILAFGAVPAAMVQAYAFFADVPTRFTQSSS